MRHALSGTVTPTLEIALERGEAVFTHAEAMLWMEEGIAMTTNAGVGLFGRFVPASWNEPFTVTFTAEVPGRMAFAARWPGTVRLFELGAAESVICRLETLLCAAASVTSKGIWSRDHISMLRLSGPGAVFLELPGDVVERDLAKGERLRVPAAHLGILDPTIVLDVERARGFRSTLFGGNGFHLATLTGPGRVTLHSLALLDLAEGIARLLPPKAD